MIRTAMILSASITLAACNFAATDEGAAPDGGATSAISSSTVPVAMPGSAATPQAAPILTPTGWGPLTIGMTRGAIEQALGSDANPQASDVAEADRCAQFHPARAPLGMLVMVEENELSRIELHEGAAIKTADGFGVGDSAEAIKAALGDRVQASPHKYVDAPAEYLAVWEKSSAIGRDGYVSDPAARGITYEIGMDGKVQSVFAGGPAIQYVEGCL